LPAQIGSFWSAKAQVDVVAINWRTKDILLGECKWGTQVVARDVIQTLLDKTHQVVPTAGEWRIHYLFFARSGFTTAAQALAEEHQAQLVTLAQLEHDMVLWLVAQQRDFGSGS
jgi:hypothetical protein